MLSGKQVRFVGRPGSGVTHDGQPVTSLELATDATGEPTVLASGPLRFFVIERAGHIGVRVRDLNNPHRLAFRLDQRQQQGRVRGRKRPTPQQCQPQLGHRPGAVAGQPEGVGRRHAGRVEPAREQVGQPVELLQVVAIEPGQPFGGDPVILGLRLRGAIGAEVEIDPIERNDRLTTGLVASVGGNAPQSLLGGHAKPHCLHAFGSLPFLASRFRSADPSQSSL